MSYYVSYYHTYVVGNNVTIYTFPTYSNIIVHISKKHNEKLIKSYQVCLTLSVAVRGYKYTR